MDSIGTLAWARRTRGRLSASEQLRFGAVGVASQLRELSQQTAAKLGLRKDELARLDLDELRLPDTAGAKEAEQVAATFPEFLRQHSLRAYLWAVALGRHDGLRFDEELVYCACLLHDAGLAGERVPRDGSCFTLASADAAEECAGRAGWDAAKGERLAEAITLHINPVVPPEQGVEAHLVCAGATLDGVGRRFWQLDPDTVTAVCERHPRMGWKHECNRLLRDHKRDAPAGRIAFYYRYGALGQLIKRAPFDE